MAAAVLAGCGGASNAPRGGAKVFADSSCGSCHTLAAAGASGKVGSSFDARRYSAAEVARWVRTGANGMPVFANTLSDAQIAAVARYVARHSGGR